MSIHPEDIAICTGDSAGGTNEYGSVPPPIVQTSLFTRPTFESLLDGLSNENEQTVYTRGQNPTVEYLEKQLAALEKGEACKCFGSGMAAVSSVFLGLLKSGDHVLFLNQVYGPTIQLAEHLVRFGIVHDIVFECDLESVERALKENTRLIWLESPSTMLFRTLDLKGVAALAASRGIMTAMDNTWSTPLFQKPIISGVDIVMHSCSKYIGGHSDVVAGAVVASRQTMKKIFYGAFLLNGGILGPFDAWLLVRGLRTLPTRMEKHQQNGLSVAKFLQAHSAVKEVFHPGVAERGHTAASESLTGFSSLFSFELREGSFAAVVRFLNRLKVFRLGVSWGGVESLALSPNRGTNQADLTKQGIPPGLVRLSVGLEDVDILIDDLQQAFDV